MLCQVELGSASTGLEQFSAAAAQACALAGSCVPIEATMQKRKKVRGVIANPYDSAKSYLGAEQLFALARQREWPISR